MKALRKGVKPRTYRTQDHSTSSDEDVSSVQDDPTPIDQDEPENDTVRYNVSMAQHVLNERNERGSLVDRGANGGICGDDARPIYEHKRRVDVTGIARHELSGLPLCDCAAKLPSDRGPVIGIFQNYAYYGKDRTIHSSGQIEHCGNKVDDHSMKVGGRQFI